MQRLSKGVVALWALAACAAASAAWADDPVGAYIGAGVGESTIRSDDPGYGLPGYYDDHQTAWKAFVGIRPLSFVGAEAEYLDFGQPGDHYHYNPNEYGNDSHPRAPALFGVGYLPIPVPWLDVFGKAGVARLKLDLNSYAFVPCTGGNNGYCYSANGRTSVTDTKFAYGVGVQSRLPLGFSVRAEYERIASGYGDPDAFTVSALWRF